MTVKAVIFDWAGTMVDFGSWAPVVAMRQAFADEGVDISDAHVRAHMGLAKIDHIRACLALPEVSAPAIPRRNRLAMLENLPVGVVEWSRGVLDRQLQDLLAREVTSSLWRASACVLLGTLASMLTLTAFLYLIKTGLLPADLFR